MSSFAPFRSERLLALGQPGFMQISPASALDIVRSLIRSRRALVESGTAATCALYSSTHIAICALK